MEVLVSVIGQKLRIGTNCRTFVEGSRNFIKFIFDLSDDWDGLEITAQFIQDGTAYNRTVGQDRSVYLPKEVHDGKCWLVVRGTGGIIIATTDMAELSIKKNSYSNNGEDDPIVLATLEEMKEYLQI